MISLFSRAKDEDIAPSEYIKYAEALRLKAKDDPTGALKEEAVGQCELAYAYAKYQELLDKYGVVDFGNQFYLGLQLLRRHPSVLKRYREQFKYILVDEFQDTNFAQFQLVKMLADPKNNITVVADDDQCIYRWRGAAYSNVLNFMDTYPKADKISLIRNYRSTQNILDSAYKLIQNNNPERFEVKAGINKKLIAESKEKGILETKHFDTNSAEADWVAEYILDKVKLKELNYKDFAILIRSNSDAQSFLQALNMQGIPWQFSGDQGLYSREAVKLCINFLRAIANHSDSLSVYYLCSSEIYNINLLDLSLCMHYAKRRNKSLFYCLKELDSIEELADVGPDAREKIKFFLNDYEKFLVFSRRETSGRLLYAFLNDTGFLKRLTKDINLENERKIRNIAKFFNIVRSFELVAKEDRVINFVGYLDLLIEAGDDPETAETDLDSDAVNILTIHKAKGLEFEVVFLVDLVMRKFPVTQRRQSIELPDGLIKEILPTGDFNIQEERRLFYVGMTRAKKKLYLTSASDYGGKRTRRISQFVFEAMGEATKEDPMSKSSALGSIERYAAVKNSTETAPGEMSKDELLNLSFYQIDDYMTCPLKYKYVHILRVPIMEHHTVIYGRAMHEAVTEYFARKLNQEKIGLSELLQIFKESFQPQGFLDEKHQEERFKAGEAALTRFYQDEETKKSKTLFLEKPFSFVFENVRISGRFDRVDQEPEGVVIIDFKTSGLSKQKEADKRAKDNLQLALYAFAYKTIFKELPKRVELHFLESGLIGQNKIEEHALELIKEKIITVSSGIRKRAFEASPGYMDCNYCAYNQICPSAILK
jgi:DNA helicase-2/ATP-dependent DNA helicase PcrA